MARLLDGFVATHPDAVIVRGGETFDDAERQDIRILGLEGFLITDDATYTALSRIADFSDLHDPRDSAAAARAVVHGKWRNPPAPHDQLHSAATGRYMLAVVVDDREP